MLSNHKPRTDAIVTIIRAMIVERVISYKGAWEEVSSQNSSELDEALELFPEVYDRYVGERSDQRTGSLAKLWEDRLSERDWKIISKIHNKESGRIIAIADIGPAKNGVSITVNPFTTSYFFSWLFTETPIAIRNGLLRVPVVLMPTSEFTRSRPNRPPGYHFSLLARKLNKLSPLSHSYPFLILAVSDRAVREFEVIEIESDLLVQDRTNAVIDRCIEFSPEYHQAGLDILNYFGTYLRQKYPEEDARVRIEQDGLKVRLIIESKDGQKEVIERALHEYQLIVSGKEPIEKFARDSIQVLDLRNQLRMVEIRIQNQNDIITFQNTLITAQTGQINHQRAQIDQFMRILESGLAADKSSVMIEFRPSITITNSVNNNHNVSYALGSISELKQGLPNNSEAYKTLDELERSLEVLETENDPQKVKKSPAMNKFRRFIERVTEGKDDLKKAVELAESGWDIFKDLAGKYNKIAEWCGLPVVPSILAKK